MQQLIEHVEALLRGDRRIAAKMITLVENGGPQKPEVLKAIYPHTGRAYILGITGSPGAGKSSLTDRIIKSLRKQGKRVGVIAVDPTSPFTGGALLGDRIRMNDHYMDRGVFIRSMGTRGSLGGLARATKEAVKVLDAFGCDYVLIETVGVGQSELDIMTVADTTVVVLTPGAGDSIQAIKAGIMEIANVFAVNKADLEGANKVVTEVEAMLDLGHGHDVNWRPPVVKTISVTGQGMDDLLAAVESHRAYLTKSGKFEENRTARLKQEVMEVVEARIKELIRQRVEEKGELTSLVDQVQHRELDPYTAALEILERGIRR